jgi:hypothetical protein
MKSMDAARVNSALNETKKALSLKSDRQLAIKLDVSRQAVGLWRMRGEMPPARALQLEWLTDKKVTWMQMCPNLVREFAEIEAR